VLNANSADAAEALLSTKSVDLVSANMRMAAPIDRLSFAAWLRTACSSCQRCLVTEYGGRAAARDVASSASHRTD